MKGGRMSFACENLVVMEFDPCHNPPAVNLGTLHTTPADTSILGYKDLEYLQVDRPI